MIKRLLLAGGSLALTCCVCEVFLRVFAPQQTGPIQFVYDPIRAAIPVPGQHGRHTLPGIYDYTYTNNSLGLRGPEIGQKTQRRILLLGDSFTYGIGVNDDQTFAYKLAQLTSSEVINAGNGGTGTDYALRFYETIGHNLNPDLVVLCFFANDFQDNEKGVFYDSYLKPKDLSQSVYARRRFLGNPVYSGLMDHSHLANLIRLGFMQTRLWQVSGPVNPNINLAPTTRYLQALDKEVGKDSKLIVVYIPSKEDIDGYRQGKASTFEAALKAIHDEKSLTPVLADSKYKSDELYLGEGHWAPKAHELAAKAISNYVGERLFRRDGP